MTSRDSWRSTTGRWPSAGRASKPCSVRSSRQAQGAIDSQAAVGAQYSFGRHTLAVDVSTVHDAIIDESSTSVMLTWHRVHSTRLDWSISAGLIDSISLGNVGFMAVSLGIGN